MCGIAGILKVWTPAERALALRTPHAQSIPEAWLDILDDSIKHRGPDGRGRFRDRAIRADGCVVDVALVHRRLSIIDHAGGHQPMVLRIPKGAPSASSGTLPPTPGHLLGTEELESHNRRVLAESHGAPDATKPELALGALLNDHIAVVFNGCIYNHRALRAELQSAGHVFTTDHSDTEVLVHGWREWRAKLMDRLVGMVALAIWDHQSGQLFLFRSSPGEKPVYRASTAARSVCAFANTPAALARLGMVIPWDSTLDVPGTLTRWITFGCHPSDTPLAGIDQPPFGTLVGAGPWDEASEAEFEEAGEIRGGDRSRAIAVQRAAVSTPTLVSEVDRIIGEAVAARIEADVPVGCLLSGGVDSSLIAVHAAKHADRLITVCVRMPFPDFDESRFADAVARSIGSDHRVVEVAPHPTEDLQRLIHSIGLPFGDSSLLPTFWACQAARKEVGVALSGDGGDELFFGYERYGAADIARTIGSIAWLVPLSLLPRTNPKGKADKLARLLIAARWKSSDALAAIFPPPDLLRLVGPNAAKHIGWGVNFGGSAMRQCELYSELQSDMLRKVDISSMLANLEVRAPLLDQTLVLAVHDLSARELMPRGQRKGLLRAVARKYLPAEIVDRPKMGFAIPIGEWFRSDYGGLRTMLLDHLNSTEPFGPPSLGIDLNMSFIRQMLDEHLGTGPSGLVKRDHSQRLYMLLVLSIWAKWIGGLR